MTSTDDILRFNFVCVDRMRSFQVAAERNTGKLIIRCSGYFGLETEYPDYKWDFIMDEGDWDKLMMSIADADAMNWGPSYLGPSAEEGEGWSLEIHILGKHTLSEGSNKYPKTYGQLFGDLLSFVKMKRRQLEPSDFDLQYISVASQSGKDCPVVMIDRQENTFTLYNMLENPEEEGAFFMQDGDWDGIRDILRKHGVYGELRKVPSSADPKLTSQYCITLAYKPGQIVQRFTGTCPDWWGPFTEEFFGKIKGLRNSGRKRADLNFLKNDKI